MGITADSVIFPNLKIFQPGNGYRFALDSVLVAAAFQVSPRTPLLDIGCGSGVIALLLARRWPEIRIFGLEIQDDLCRLAQKSIITNDLNDKVRLVRGDARRCREFFKSGAFGTIVSNPPYWKIGTGRLPSNPERAAARHELFITLPDFLSALEYLLQPDGTFLFTWKPERLSELKRILPSYGLQLATILPVCSRKNDMPFLLLCRGHRSSKKDHDVITQKTLFIYKQHAYSKDYEHILRQGSFPPSFALQTSPG